MRVLVWDRNSISSCVVLPHTVSVLDVSKDFSKEMRELFRFFQVVFSWWAESINDYCWFLSVELKLWLSFGGIRKAVPASISTDLPPEKSTPCPCIR